MNKDLGFFIALILAACVLIGGALSYGVTEICGLVAAPERCEALGAWVWDFFTGWLN